jgi:uncharacterized protein
MNACDICVSGPVPPNGLAGRVAAVDWPRVEADLEAQGAAVIKRLLNPVECHELSSLYQRDDTFRSRVVMARHGFGRGEYRYFDYPLPQLVGTLRESLYVRLAPVANRWYDAMGMTARFPDRHVDFIDRCHAAGQRKPTPLLLQYGTGDYNCLHQDLYGEIHFPLQAILLLHRPFVDYDGGELILVEQRPRRQSRPVVVPLTQGAIAVIPVKERPVESARGTARGQVRHGVSVVHRGLRQTLGLIFHDAA